MTLDKGDINESYSYQRFSLDHYAAMKILFQSSFGTGLAEDVFLKRYDTSSLGHPVIGFLAFHIGTNAPAAYYGVFPVKLNYKGKIFLVAQSGDTMTHEQHRKKGLFVWLAKKTFDTCRKENIQLIFGLPNKNSYPGFINHLGWVQRDTISRYDLKLRFKTVPLPKLFAKLKLFKTYTRTVAKLTPYRLKPSVSEFSNKEGHTDMAKVSRSAEYLQYKSNSDKLFISINDVVFWIKLTDVLWIGDVDDYKKINDRVIRKLRGLAFFLGYNTICFHFNDSVEKPAFLRRFRKYNEEPSCFYYFDNELQNVNLLLTGADFDTW
jgi:hypothetical protein